MSMGYFDDDFYYALATSTTFGYFDDRRQIFSRLIAYFDDVVKLYHMKELVVLTTLYTLTTL